MSISEAPQDRYDWRRHIPALAATAMIAAGLVSFVLLPLRAPARADWPVKMMIGKSALEINSSYMRRGPQRAGGLLERADLILQWPDFRAAELVTRDADGNPGPARTADHLLVSLRAAEGADPAHHAVALYGRFVESDAWTSGTGLVMRRFKPGSPYADEELFISPPDGGEFTARCPRQTVEGSVNGRCLAQFRVGALDMTVNFDATLLGDWQHLRDGVVKFAARSLR